MANVFDQAPARVWAGPGSGRVCALCDNRIDTADVEYELDYETAATVCVHVGCYLHRRPTCRAGGASRPPRPRST